MITKLDAYTMPIIDEFLDIIGKGNYFTKLDAFLGYHQITICKEDVEKTAFGCLFEHYEWLKMLIGLVNDWRLFRESWKTY